MVFGGPIRHLVARVTAIMSAFLLVMVMLLSSVGTDAPTDTDHTFVTVAVQSQVQGTATCHAQMSCTPFIAPANIGFLTPNAVHKTKYAQFSQMASKLFRPAFDIPPPRA